MASNPTLLTQPIAANGAKNVIPNTTATLGAMSQDQGFPAETSLPLGAGGVAPSREDFNGAFNLLSAQNFMTQKGWVYKFDAGQDYYAGCIVRDTTDGALYECINDVSAGGSVPSANSVNWQPFPAGGGVSVGFILPYGGSTTPDGWLDCDGSAISRTMYADLFAAIGTTWGVGDGSTTFNLPRSEDLVMQGASATNPVGTYKTAGLPNIEVSGSDSGVLDTVETVHSSALFTSDAVTVSTGRAFSGSANADYDLQYISFDASQSNAIYGNSDTVQPPAACVRFMIKYE